MTDGFSVMLSMVRQLVSILIGSSADSGKVAGIDWDLLIGLAKDNGVSQMLYTAMLRQDIVPQPDITGRLRSIHFSGLIDGTRRHHHFEKILEAFADAGLVVIPIKGAWLSETVYPNIAMRGMADIDLWIQREDLECAISAMETIGYRMALSDVNRPRELQEALLGEILFLKQDAPPVELHWKIFRGEWFRYTSLIDECSIRERSFPWKGEKIRQLQPEDAFIHVAIHLAVNNFMSDSVLRSMLDLRMICKRFEVDWELVVKRAVLWRVATPLWLVGDSMIRLFGPDEKITAALASVKPSAFRRWLLYRFFSPEGAVTGKKITGLSKFTFLIFLVDRPVDVLRLAWKAVWPDKTWLTLRYGLKQAPAWRIVFQRIVHPLRVIRYREF